MKMGMKMKIMAGHSMGHPRRKMTPIRISRTPKSEAGMPSRVSVITPAEPSREKTAPNMRAPTARYSTRPESVRVWRTASTNIGQVSRR